jgi:hypothetical protein
MANMDTSEVGPSGWSYQWAGDRWVHRNGTMFTLEAVQRMPKALVQDLAVRRTGESLPEAAWPEASTTLAEAISAMALAEHEHRKRTARAFRVEL